MAYAAIVSLSQILVEQVTDDQMMKALHEKLCFLQSFMEDMYAYNNYTREKAEYLVEERIREAAYQAQDVIEIHFSNLQQVDSEFQNLDKRSYKQDLQWVNEIFDSIIEDAMKIINKKSHENETPIPRRYSLGGAGSSSRSPITRTVVGFNDKLLEIKAQLCGDSPILQMISIVGMGGIGKTTLAKHIFDDSLIVEHFYTRAWITISQEYCIRSILLGLLTSLNAMYDPSEKSDVVLAEHVYKSLKGRRHLIVMDDMWSTKAWDDIRRLLPDDNNGSRVIITSRLVEVAIYADSSSPFHEMQLLNEDLSWSLLQNKVFGKEVCPPELEKIGRIIAGKCGGLPLGIVLVAGLVSKVDAALNCWEKFAVNVSSTLATNDDEHLVNIFSLSYNNLPHHLRACFLYMGGFPEDSEISISKLTMLWTAEGFLKPITSKSSEETAKEYVMDLVKRNLISVTKKGSNHRLRFCRIHDLLRDFCIQKAHDENFLHVKKNDDNATQQGILQNKRRLSNFPNDYILPTTKISHSSVRSLLFHNNKQWYLTSLAISSTLLRVLDGPDVDLTFIPLTIFELVHLRYIAFSQERSVKIVVPARILELRNLQTLIIGTIGTLVRVYSPILNATSEPTTHLPREIWEMPKLRYLIFNNCCFLPVPFSTNTFVLANLQTLTRLSNFSLDKEAIKMIPNLKKLGVIYHVQGVINWSEYHLDNLFHLRQLESLNLTCKVRHWKQSPLTDDFALPLNLKKLTLSGCKLSLGNLGTISQLPNLETLKLRHTGFEGEEWKSSEGEFVRLKFLLMEHLKIKCWVVEEHTHFPKLEQLIIKNCWKLEQISSEIGDIPTLRYFEVICGLKSARESAIRIQEEQMSLGNDSLQVHVWGL